MDEQPGNIRSAQQPSRSCLQGAQLLVALTQNLAHTNLSSRQSQWKTSDPSHGILGVAKFGTNPYGGFHKWGVPRNGLFVRENPIEMDDLGVSLF